MMFRSYKNTFKSFFEGLCNHCNCDLFTSENNMLFSRMKISCLRAKSQLVFHCCFYNKLISETEQIGFDTTFEIFNCQLS